MHEIVILHFHLFISWVVCDYIQSTHWLATGYVIRPDMEGPEFGDEYVFGDTPAN